MGAPKAKQSSTLRYARLLSFLSITFTLFMLGALGLVYVLEQGLSKEVRERISFSVELSDEPGANTEATLSELRALPYVRSVELITADSAAKSLTDVLGEDPTKILGYTCQKALGEFRGRKYIAWFTSDIPLSDGPWKFCGLPGLILAVQDTEAYFVFTCIGVDNKSTPIRFWTYPHTKSTREKLRATILRMHKQPILFCEQSLGINIYIGNTNKNRDFSFPWLWLEAE